MLCRALRVPCAKSFRRNVFRDAIAAQGAAGKVKMQNRESQSRRVSFCVLRFALSAAEKCFPLGYGKRRADLIRGSVLVVS